MIKCIVIDDEELAVRSLVADLAMYCPQLEVVATAQSGKDGILAIKKHQPQLIFLDIAMPWMNGFEMLELIDDINFQIIFVTAFDQYAAKAFRASAVDYLLKPVESESLKQAVAKAEQLIKQPAPVGILNNLLNNIKLPSPEQKVALPCRDGYEFIEPKQILYCEAEGAYTRIYFMDSNRVLLISKSLGDLEGILPEDKFQRIHNSSMINLMYVTHFMRTDGGYVQMNNGKKLMVSKTRKEALMNRLGLR